MSLLAHPDRPVGLQDLLDAPDDGYRYEVLDGALVVNAAPIVDPTGPKVTLLALEGDRTYIEVGVFGPGELVSTDRPYPIRFDPADI